MHKLGEQPKSLPVVGRKMQSMATNEQAELRGRSRAAARPGGVELGGSTDNFTASFGSETQFVDLKEAYTSGSTRFHEVADVSVSTKSVRSVEEAKRLREAEMSRVDPDEKARFAAAASAYEERERQRRLRLAQQDTAAEGWADQMRRRLMVSDR